MTEGKAKYIKQTTATPSNLLSTSTINNGEWHNITLTITLDTVVIDVDGNQATTDAGYNPQTLAVSSMSVGGVPSGMLPDAQGRFNFVFSRIEMQIKMASHELVIECRNDVR